MVFKRIAGILEIILGAGTLLYSLSISTDGLTGDINLASIMIISRILALLSLGFILQGIVNLVKTKN